MTPNVRSAEVATNDKSAAAPSKEQSFLRLDGTDLHIGDLPPITFHGFASQGFLSSDTYNYLGKTKEGSFEFTEAAVNASISPFARTRISAQAFLFDVGNVGRWSLGLDYAMIDYTLRDEIGFRAGRIRRPEGIYNSIQDIDLTRTSVLLPQGMYDARWRDFNASVDGGSVYGNIGMGGAGSFSYEVYGGQVQLTEQGGVARWLQDLLNNPPTEYAGLHGFPQAGLQLWWTTPIEGLRAGAAWTEAFGFSYDYKLNVPPVFGGGPHHSEIDAPSEHVSLEYQHKSWTFQAEYKHSVYDSKDDLRGPSKSGNDTWYVGAAYRVNKWFEVGSYYTEYYADVSQREGTDAFQKDFALSLRFDPLPWWIVKVEGHSIHGTALLRDNANNPPAMHNNDGWFMLALKTTISF